MIFLFCVYFFSLGVKVYSACTKSQVLDIFSRRHPFNLFEHLREGAARRESCLHRHTLDLSVWVILKHAAGIIDSQGVDEIVECVVAAVRDNLVEISFVGAHLLHEFAHGEMVGEIELLVDEQRHHLLLHLLAFLLAKGLLHLYRLCQFLSHHAVRIQGVIHKPCALQAQYYVTYHLGYRMVDEETDVKQGAYRQRQPLHTLGNLQWEVALVGILALVNLEDLSVKLFAERYEEDDIRHAYQRDGAQHHYLICRGELDDAQDWQQQRYPAQDDRLHKDCHSPWAELLEEEIAFHHDIGKRCEEHHAGAVDIKQRHWVAYIKKVW